MQDKDEVQHQISILLFIGLACGIVMLICTRLFGTWGITGKHLILFLNVDLSIIQYVYY